VVVRGLTSSPVHNVDEAKALFEAGMKARAVASTDVHEHSSRSHCIVRVDVRGVLRGKQTSVQDTSGKDIFFSSRHLFFFFFADNYFSFSFS
jgi:hypothetical protein